MLNLLEELPLMLVGTRVLNLLSLSDIVVLERACGSKKTHQLFLDLIPLRPSFELPSSKHKDISCLEWFMKTGCNIKYLNIYLPGYNPAFHRLQVDEVELHFESTVTMEDCKPLFENNLSCRIRSIKFIGNYNKDVVEKLSLFARNVEKINIINLSNINDWLNTDILSRWKLKELSLSHSIVAKPLITLIVQTCTELTSIELRSDTVDDAVVMALAQHCPKLETLVIESDNITYTSLIALSERGLPLKELDIHYIPNIPIADIARRCSHALSCIRHLNTYNLQRNGQDFSILISYMAGLTSLCLWYDSDMYIPLLTQHCHKLTEVAVCENNSIDDILALCRANPLLQEFDILLCVITDTTLIELMHACPHLHTLELPVETDITDIGILVLSEHCPHLQRLEIGRCPKVTEAAVLQLLQRCHKLTRLEVSSSSLSEETWTQLDKNTQKRVSRW